MSSTSGPWLGSTERIARSVRLRINPEDYPDGIVPALTPIRNTGELAEGDAVFVTYNGPEVSANAAWLFTDLPLADRG